MKDKKEKKVVFDKASIKEKKINIKRIVSYRKIFFLIFVLILLGLVYLFRGLFVVALVNNKPITRFALVKELETNFGKETLETLISKELVLQEANSLGIGVDESYIDSELEKIKNVVEAQGSTIEDALAQQGQNMNILRDNLRYKGLLEKILEKELTVTEEEKLSYYEQNKEYYDEGTTYESIKDQIEEMLKQQKFQAEVKKLIDRLKQESKLYQVVYF